MSRHQTSRGLRPAQETASGETSETVASSTRAKHFQNYRRVAAYLNYAFKPTPGFPCFISRPYGRRGLTRR